MNIMKMNILQLVRKNINKALAPFGVEVIRSKNTVLDMGLYSEDKRPAIPRYINIGAGDFYHPYWHNLDTPNEYYADWQKGRLQILYDLTSTSSLPFDANTIQVAYTSHVIEHINNEDVQHLFREVYRCLQPGGYFRITCPDIDLEYDAFCRNDKSFWKEANAYGVFNTSIEQSFLDHFASSLTMTHPDSIKKLTDAEVHDLFLNSPKEQALDYIISQIPTEMQKGHPGDHINWFNVNKLTRLLRDAGFNNIYESRYGQSKTPILRNTRLFDSTCPGLSLYMECKK